MVHIHREPYLEMAPEAVWNVVADFPNVYKWASMVEHSTQESVNAQGVDAARACHVPGFGKITETVEQWDEGKGLTYRWEASGPVKEGRSTWTLRREGTGTRVVIDITAEMRYGLLGELMGQTIMKVQMNRLTDDALKGLEHYIRTGRHIDRTVAKRLGLKAA